MMRLGELLSGTPAARWSSAQAREAVIDGLCQDSRSVQRGDLFVGMPGESVDGRRFVEDAHRREAAAILIEDDGRALPDPGVAVTGLRSALGGIASRFFGEPSAQLEVVAVTGTNGKTSCSQYVAQLCAAAGVDCGVIGTMGYGVPGALVGPSLTTPEPVRLQSILAEFVAEGRSAAAIEASSHGLVQGRLNGTRLRVAAFTNITRDHLDYHADFDAYKAAKALLFRWPGLEAAVVNADDPWGAELVAMCEAPVWTYSATGREATVQAYDCEFGPRGTRFTLAEGGRSATVGNSLLGDFNVANGLAAFAAVRALGVPFDEAAAALGNLRYARGRMELLPTGASRPAAMIDYAHTPDALESALRAARGHCWGSLWVVFGCGGDRDRGKRADMGRIAETLAEHVVLTDDNPRSESSAAIIADIASGLGRLQPTVLNDRAEAIRFALHSSGPGDLVVIAGKGHEDYQERDGVRRPFSDFEVARQALEDGAWT